MSASRRWAARRRQSRRPEPEPSRSRSGGRRGGADCRRCRRAQARRSRSVRSARHPRHAAESPNKPPGAPSAGGATPAALSNGSPQDQYNAAFGLLRRADYPDAEQALKAFIQRYPSDALAGNAQYWLGETYYVRKDYENAATAFAVGYQKYPHSGKAADNLLKLGMSLGNLGKKSEACSAFTRLDRDFPTAPPNVKDRVSSERHQIGC